jgi:integrase
MFLSERWSCAIMFDMQRGTIRKDRRHWYVLFWIASPEGRKRKCVRLACVDDNLSVDVLRLKADEVLKPFNDDHYTPEASMSVLAFIERVYMPFVRTELRKSTVHAYSEIVRCHLRDKGLDKIALRDFRAVHVQRLLNRDITTVGRTSKLRIKSFLSGTFRHAKEEGILDGENPVRDVKIRKSDNEPKSKRASMPVYLLQEISDLLACLGEPERTIVATFALTGMRYAEVRGLKWSDYDGESLAVTRTIWRTHEDDPKTPESAARVPVLEVLRGALNRHRKRTGGKADDFIFAGPKKGRSLNLANVARRVIVPAIRKKGIPWKGWHAFRRGLATNLSDLGVPAKTVQGILRHSQISTTMKFYIKSLDEQHIAAVKQLEDVLVPFGTELGNDDDDGPK